MAILNLRCRSKNDRAIDLAEKAVQSQNKVNSHIQEVNKSFVELNKDLQLERRKLQEERLVLDQHFDRLEQNRLELNRQLKQELAWSESFRFLGIVIAAASPLFLCVLVIWLINRRQDRQVEIARLLSSNPRITESQMSPLEQLLRIEHKSGNDSNSNQNQ